MNPSDQKLLGANTKNAISITGYGIDEHRIPRPNDGVKMNQAKHSTSAAGSTGTAATKASATQTATIDSNINILSAVDSNQRCPIKQSKQKGESA